MVHMSSSRTTGTGLGNTKVMSGQLTISEFLMLIWAYHLPCHRQSTNQSPDPRYWVETITWRPLHDYAPLVCILGDLLPYSRGIRISHQNSCFKYSKRNQWYLCLWFYQYMTYLDSFCHIFFSCVVHIMDYTTEENMASYLSNQQNVWIDGGCDLWSIASEHFLLQLKQCSLASNHGS